MKGFSISTPKLVENRFWPGDDPQRELLEDWDTRTVRTVLL